MEGAVDLHAIHHASAIVVDIWAASTNEPLRGDFVIDEVIKHIENGDRSVRIEGLLRAVLVSIFVKQGHSYHLICSSRRERGRNKPLCLIEL